MKDNSETTEEKLKREGYRIVMSIARDTLADLIDRYKLEETVNLKSIIADQAKEIEELKLSLKKCSESIPSQNCNDSQYN